MEFKSLETELVAGTVRKSCQNSTNLITLLNSVVGSDRRPAVCHGVRSSVVVVGTTDYGQTKAKFLILCAQIQIPTPNRFVIWI